MVTWCFQMKDEGGPDSTLDELDLLLEDDGAGDDEEEALRKCVDPRRS